VGLTVVRSPHANLMEEVYVHQLKGFEDHKQPKKVWRLLKSLYGLKQAPFECSQVIDSHLHGNGFEPIVVFIVLYMDDRTIVGHNDLITDMKRTLCTKFMMKDLGEAKSLLGAEILHDWVNPPPCSPS
jgi:hypothetical protein